MDFNFYGSTAGWKIHNNTLFPYRQDHTHHREGNDTVTGIDEE
jgi:hypothetical protein